ncbi:MAG TPA: hypothetical protein VFH54_16665 [Mycobacteriales bacterium]|nr:hypothetical protein [Mycobacteriales bacterium]
MAPDDERSSEEWARQLWEGAPASLRWFMSMGWRGVLRLDLSPERSPDHVLGWPIVDRRSDKTTCRSQSSFLTAFNTFARQDARIVWSTYVYYDRPIARLLWPMAAQLHRPIVRFSLARVRRQRSVQ